MNNIKKLRIISGLTQAQLADAIRVSRQTIIDMESERTHAIDPIYINRMCDVFNCGVEDVYGDDVIYLFLKKMPKNKEECEWLIDRIKRSEAWVS